MHGACGAWGVISVGLFADGVYGDGWNGVPGPIKGLFYGGGFSQLFAELIGVAVCFAFVFTSFFVFFKVVGALVGNRVSAENELAGLDLPEMGALAYPEFAISSTSVEGIAGVAASPRPAGRRATLVVKPVEN